MKFLVRFFFTAASVWIVSALDLGVHADGTKALVVGSVVLALLNTFLTPMLQFAVAPFVVVSFGLLFPLFLLPPAGAVLIAANLVPGFQVAGWGAALILTLTIFALNMLLGGGPSIRITTTQR
jgi:putative membrane protein